MIGLDFTSNLHFFFFPYVCFRIAQMGFGSLSFFVYNFAILIRPRSSWCVVRRRTLAG